MGQAPAQPPSPADLAGETIRMDALPEGCVDEDPFIGSIVADRYRIEERIAKGGMGAVYKAEQMAMRRPVAIKLLRTELMGEATAIARFQREALAASRIESPHVVTLFDFGKTEGGMFFMAMELLAGETLAKRIDREKVLPQGQAVLVGIAIAKALAAAHDAGVIHRDLKPDNVMLCGREGLVKVLDFGIAKMMDAVAIDEDGEPLTAAGVVMGTAEYMSPEAIAKRTLGPAADLYGLGVILYEMLAGRPPFKHQNAMVVLGRHLRRPPPALRTFRPDVNPSLELLVTQLLEKDPSLRIADGREVARRLEAIGRQLGMTTVRTSAARSSTLRTLVASGIGGLAAVALGIAATLLIPGLRRRVWTGEPRPPPGAVAGDAHALAAVPGPAAAGTTPAQVRPTGPSPTPPAHAPGTAPPGALTGPVPPPVAPSVPPLIDPVSPNVTLTLRIVPTDAILTWDEQPIGGEALQVPREERQHLLRAAAPGYLTREVTVTPRGDMVIALELPVDPHYRAPRRPGAPPRRGSPAAGGGNPGMVRIYE